MPSLCSVCRTAVLDIVGSRAKTVRDLVSNDVALFELPAGFYQVAYIYMQRGQNRANFSANKQRIIVKSGTITSLGFLRVSSEENILGQAKSAEIGTNGPVPEKVFQEIKNEAMRQMPVEPMSVKISSY